MGQVNTRFVAKAETGKGWRIWDRKTRRWWEQDYENLPAGLLKELNGLRRPDELVRLQKETPRKG